MGKIWIPGGGDGADLDVITAAALDVRKGKVIVDKDGNPLTGIMAEIAAKTYTPGTSNQVIAANQFLAGAQTIKGDGNLNANNIVYGKSIFGVAGNVRKYAVKNSTVSSSGTASISISAGYDPGRSMYKATIPTGFNVSCIAWTDGTLVEFWSGNPAHCAGWNYRFDFNMGGAWHVNSTNAVLPCIENGTVWYCVAGYY